MKKALLLACILLYPILAQTQWDVRTSEPFYLYDVGESFTVDIKLSQADGYIDAIGCELFYPVDLLHYDGFDFSGTLLEFWADKEVTESSPGVITIRGTDYPMKRIRSISKSALQESLLVKLNFAVTAKGADKFRLLKFTGDLENATTEPSIFCSVMHQEVADYVRDNVLGGQFTTQTLWMTPVALDSFYTARDVDPEIEDLRFTYSYSWLVMIDDAPEANWGHPCRWLFVNNDLSEHTEPIEKDFPPRVFSLIKEGFEIEFRCVGVTPWPCPDIGYPMPSPPEPAGSDEQCLYAVLISGGAFSSSNYSRYRQNLESMYRKLRGCGYPKVNIFVYYSDGSPLDLDNLDGDNVHSTGNDVTDAADETIIRTRIQNLCANLDHEEDVLFIYVSNHGSDNAGLCLWDFDNSGHLETDEIYSPGELGNDTDNCRVCRLFMLHDQCFSGEFLPIANDGNHDNSAIYVAANDHESSYGREYMAQWEQNDPGNTLMNDMHDDVVQNGNLTSTPGMAEGTSNIGGIGLCLCGNHLPVATNLKIEPPDPTTADDLIGSYTYYDADGDPEGSSEIRWYKDGSHQQLFDDLLTIPSSATTKCQHWRFTVRPHDGQEFGELVYSDSVHIGNTPPIATDLVIMPSDPYCSADPLIASYIYQDVDGDPEAGSQIRWYREGAHQPDFDDQPIIPSDSLTCCEEWYFTVRPSDGEAFGDMQTSATVRIQMLLVIEAEAMHNRIPWYGNPVADGWRLTHQDHPIFESVSFPKNFSYDFNVIARGEIAGKGGSDDGIAPWMNVEIGSAFNGCVEVNDTNWDDYAFVAAIPEGNHQLSLSFLNDWWNPNVGDRNLVLDKVEISCHFDLATANYFTFEAEDMNYCQNPKTYPDGDYMVLYRPHSYVAHNIFFGKQQELTFSIYAKGDYIDGGWPSLDLKIDDAIVGSATVNDANPKVYEFTFTAITEGEHCIKITYHAGTWAHNRLLYIDKLVIMVQDGGLLRPVVRDQDMSADLPETFSLSQNYPNPFNPDTYIAFQLPEATPVKLKILNTLGQEVRTLVDEFRGSGYYVVHWDGLDHAGQPVVSGIYLYQMEAGGFSCIKKMAYLK